MKRWWSWVIMLALGACGRSVERQPEFNRAQAVPVVNEAHPTVPAPGTGPNARTPLAPVKPATDPKSTEAPMQLAQHFADLLNQRKFNEAYMLLGPNAGPRKDFDLQLVDIKDLRVTVGPPGEPQGAAGSIYIGIPLTIAGEANGEHLERQSGLVLRRVNDVPGSTEAQRRWHIERIGWNGD